MQRPTTKARTLPAVFAAALAALTLASAVLAGLAASSAGAATVPKTLRGWAGYHRHGVSKAVFNAVDSHAWNRIMRWLRRKYQGRTGLGMPELRRRFCVPGTWKFAHNGVVFTGAATVPVTRYRYRGTRIPSPTPDHRPGPPADPAAKAHGAPGAVRVARRVRPGGPGRPTGSNPGRAPRPYPT